MTESALSEGWRLAAACISCGGTPLKVKKRQLCNACYCRWQKYGDPAAGGLREGISPLERFNHYVPDQSDPQACWLWTGPTLNREVCNYGRLYVGDGVMVQAHRWSYEHFVDAIPEGLTIDHVKKRGCKNTLCVNPAHLEAVPHKINLERGEGVGVLNARKECCPKCGGNYEVGSDGRRICRPCINENARQWMRETGRTTGEGKGARNREKVKCSKGHDYTPETTYINPKTGGRDCKICRGERRNRSARKLRAERAA